MDNLSLQARNTLQGNLDTQIATRNHDAIRCIYYLVDVVDALLVFYFRYNLDVAVMLVEYLLHGENIFGRANERVGDKVDVLFDGKKYVATVFFG